MPSDPRYIEWGVTDQAEYLTIAFAKWRRSLVQPSSKATCVECGAILIEGVCLFEKADRG